MRLHAAVVIGLLCVAVGPRAHADSFNDEYQAGIDAYRLGKYDEAKKHFDAAKAIDATKPGPWRWLGAIAKTEGQWPACVEMTREAMRLNPKSTEIGATRQLHDECRAAWGKPAFDDTYDIGQGALSVTTDQVGAQVEVNGIKYGSTPMSPRTFPIGDSEVQVSKAGFLTQTKKVAILEGIVTDVDFVLEVDPTVQTGGDDKVQEVTIGWIKVETGAPSAVVRIDGKDVTVDAQGRYEVEPGPHEVTVTAPGHEGMTKKVRVTKGQMITVKAPLRSQVFVDATRKKGHIVLGTGVGLLAVGLVTGWLSMAASDEARDLWEIETTRPGGSVDPPSEDVQPIHSRAEIDKLVSRSKTLGIVSDVAIGAGIVAIGVATYFLVKGRPQGDKATISLSPTRGGGAVVGEVRW